MRIMSVEEVIESFRNSWRALCKQYDNYPDESTRQALNLISKIIREVEDKVKENQEITTDNWVDIFIKNQWFYKRRY